MKMQVLRDAKGDVVAAFERTRGALVSVRAEVAEGHKLQEEDVDDSLLDEDGILGVFRKARPAERELGD